MYHHIICYKLKDILKSLYKFTMLLFNFLNREFIFTPLNLEMYRRTIGTNYKRNKYKIFATPQDQLPEVEPTRYIFYATLEALST